MNQIIKVLVITACLTIISFGVYFAHKTYAYNKAMEQAESDTNSVLAISYLEDELTELNIQLSAQKTASAELQKLLPTVADANDAEGTAKSISYAEDQILKLGKQIKETEKKILLLSGSSSFN